MKSTFSVHGYTYKLYESNAALGPFAPIPFGSVELSEQSDMLESGHYSDDSHYSESAGKAFANFRLGKIHFSNQLFRQLLTLHSNTTGEEDKHFALMGFAVTSTLQKDYAESNEVLSYVAGNFTLSREQQRSVTYWQMRNYLGLGSVETFHDEACRIKGASSSWQLIELISKSKLLNRKLISDLKNSWGLSYDKSYTSAKWKFLLADTKVENPVDLFRRDLFSLDHQTMVTYLKRYGLEKFLNNWMSIHGGIPYTSEVLAALSLYCHNVGGPQEFRNLYTADRITLIDRISLTPAEREELALESITSDRAIRDFNTSNFGGRTYTLDLSDSKTFKHLSSQIDECLKENFSRIKEIMAPWQQPVFNDLDKWFDASFTSGGSNISPHLHTAGLAKTYHFTAVYYAQIPADMKKGEGDLTFRETDMQNDTYKKSPVDTKLKVQAGDLYAFPSYFFHSTTPSFTRNVRLTFNFDYSTPRRTFCV